ncbi:MAG: ATP-binding protein [Moorea sp. SIO1G6]|uniref:ATP-binding protein n=1 Tax=Moorena sp. SIO1G6 TaxID=2607840 RepID=UPI0013C27092|nr:ATP-binding protein [Moorena sp. SIO1G6]NES82689.1 ATP-binding protein [Moorena sp. SIO2B7]NET64955.1 ATP-binding protein [Moorena sp. SIO1G6]
MTDLQTFYRATNPSKTLAVDNEEDRKYYIDLSSVRGGQIIEKLRKKIAIFSSNQPTCELFTGHIGCGKSTELLRLKLDLERSGFHVVYFESDQDLEMSDVDISDILLAIARRVSESLEGAGISLQAGYFQKLFGEVKDILKTPMELSDVEFSVGIATITSQAKASPKQRDKLRGYLEPRTTGLIEAINQEVLEPAIKKLKQTGKKGLVVIVDNLDRVDSIQKPFGRLQPEYLFADRGAQLRGLGCHVVYTIPLSLRFSNDFGMVTERFMTDPKVLPMVPVKLRNGSKHEQGMALLRQMVLARAFPDLEPNQRLTKITAIFDSAETLDRLCLASGGHVRNLLRFLNEWIMEEGKLPLSRNGLERMIKAQLHKLVLAITNDEWDLLGKVAKEKKVTGDDGYEILIRSRFVYEYYDQEEPWFDVNPILAEAKELKL